MVVHNYYLTESAYNKDTFLLTGCAYNKAISVFDVNRFYLEIYHI